MWTTDMQVYGYRLMRLSERKKKVEATRKSNQGQWQMRTSVDVRAKSKRGRDFGENYV